jgi:pumilio family protein 6
MNNAAAMLRSANASDVLFETCSGGAGNVIAHAVGGAQMRELHAAVAEAARASAAKEDGAPAEENEENDGKQKTLPLHEDYFSTRALRRMCLEISGDARGEKAPPSFASALWEGAAARDVRAWIGGHGAKVVAAIVKAGDAETKKACVAALQKALPKGQDPLAWAEGFFRHHEKREKPSKGVEELSKTAKPSKTPIGKTPIGKTPIGKTPMGKTPDAEAKSVSKSPKDTKFSPLLTRRQRAEKVAKSKKGVRDV